MSHRSQEVQQELRRLMQNMRETTYQQEAHLAYMGQLLEELTVKVPPHPGVTGEDAFLADPLWMGRIQP